MGSLQNGRNTASKQINKQYFHLLSKIKVKALYTLKLSIETSDLTTHVCSPHLADIYLALSLETKESIELMLGCLHRFLSHLPPTKLYMSTLLDLNSLSLSLCIPSYTTLHIWQQKSYSVSRVGLSLNNLTLHLSAQVNKQSILNLTFKLPHTLSILSSSHVATFSAILHYGSNKNQPLNVLNVLCKSLYH